MILSTIPKTPLAQSPHEFGIVNYPFGFHAKGSFAQGERLLLALRLERLDTTCTKEFIILDRHALMPFQSPCLRGLRMNHRFAGDSRVNSQHWYTVVRNKLSCEPIEPVS